jgi:hypothetical protein
MCWIAAHGEFFLRYKTHHFSNVSEGWAQDETNKKEGEKRGNVKKRKAIPIAIGSITLKVG